MADRFCFLFVGFGRGKLARTDLGRSFLSPFSRGFGRMEKSGFHRNGGRMMNAMVEPLVETLVTCTIELNGQIFIIKNVPARVNEETGEQLFAPSTIESIQRSPENPRTFTKLALLKSQLSRSASLKFAPSRLAFLKFVPILDLNAILALSVQKIAMTRNAIHKLFFRW
jgi:hypothetical protein